MAVDLLDAPLRISWDVCSSRENRHSPDQLLLIAQQLVDAGIFFVTLEGTPLQHESIVSLVEQLADGGCQTALVTDGSAAELDLVSRLPEAVALFVDAACAVRDGRLDQAILAEIVTEIRNDHREPSLLWIPRHGQHQLLPDFLRFCAANSIRRFKLPNQKIDVNSGQEERGLLPGCSDLEQLQQQLRSEGLPHVENLQLEVHDLFLWELLQPLSGGERSEYGGCQAANSLGHITAAAELYPCSSWPEALGNLFTENLLDLWQSPRRMAIRREIEEIPTGCDGCRDYQVCFGGCRGLSRFCRQDQLGRDLLCAEKR